MNDFFGNMEDGFHSLIEKELVNGDIEVTCFCGAVETIVLAGKEMDSFPARHFLINEIWPFRKPPKSDKWPHNTPEDDLEDKEKE